MKRKFRKWWSTILPISTKQTITSHLNSLNTKKKRGITTYDIGNPDPGLGHTQKCGGVKPSPLDNWISNGNAFIKKSIKTRAQIRVRSKRPHTITTIKAIFSIEIILFKIICDNIIQTYIPSCVMLLPFKVSTTS